jgi:hypothetical protein
MTGDEYAEKVTAFTDAELRSAVLEWFSQAVDAFEGNPDPSEIQGKILLTEMLKRGWE